MSLLTDLRGLDLSSVVNARTTISAAVNADDLKALVSQGAAASALGALGTSLSKLTVDSPEALLKPVAAALEELAPHLNVDAEVIGRYVDSVKEGIDVVAGLASGLSGDPATWKLSAGGTLSSLFSRIQEEAGRYASVSLDGVDGLQRLYAVIDGGLPTDPVAFADLALDALVPFPKASAKRIRTAVSAVLEGASSFALPTGRAEGVVLALDAVTTAANAGDHAGVQRAMAALQQVRVHALGVVTQDLGAFESALAALRCDELLAPVLAAEATLRSAEDGAIEFLGRLREMLTQARRHIEELDPTQMTALLERIAAQLETEAKVRIEAPLDREIARLDAFLRDLLRHLPLRKLRTQVSDALHAVARAIVDADLQRFAREALGVLEEIREAVSPEALQAEVQRALAAVREAIDRALQPIVDALQQVSAAISGVGGQAEAVLSRALGALRSFREAIDEITALVGGLGIDAAGAQVVQSLTTIRETAEKVLTVAPLPEPMRPLVEEMIDTLQGLDVDATISARVEVVLAQIHIPESVADEVTAALSAVDEAIIHLIPAELIASIDAEIAKALETIRGFDPASLLPDVSSYLEEAAAKVLALDPAPLAATLRAPFEALLGLIDALDPVVLLQPAVEAYDRILGQLPLPSPESAVRGMHTLIGDTGLAVAESLAAPAQRALGGAVAAPDGGASTSAPSGGGAVPDSSTPPVVPPIKPGDAIRFLGYIPAKLREGLAALNAGAAGEVLRQIDSLTGGLARDLRAVEGALWRAHDEFDASLNAALRPIAAAQLRAQFALQRNVSLRAGPLAIDIDASVGTLASFSPGALREELASPVNAARSAARTLAGRGGAVSATLERAALALERSSLSRLGSDLDGLLAALDPEPIAAELDALVVAALKKAPQYVAAMDTAFQAALARIMDLFKRMNPMVLAQKFFNLFDTIREELQILDPGRLAAELGEIHRAIRDVVVAFDPALFVAEASALVQTIATSIRTLNPQTLLGDLAPFDGIAARVEAASPTRVLSGLGESLDAVGKELHAIDVRALLATVNDLPQQVSAMFAAALAGIKREILALLEALRFAQGSASASVSVSGGIG